MVDDFKPGDQVMFIGTGLPHDGGGGFTIGRVYTVGGKYYNNSNYTDRYGVTLLGIQEDDNGEPNGWSSTYFRMTSGPW